MNKVQRVEYRGQPKQNSQPGFHNIHHVPVVNVQRGRDEGEPQGKDQLDPHGHENPQVRPAGRNLKDKHKNRQECHQDHDVDDLREDGRHWDYDAREGYLFYEQSVLHDGQGRSGYHAGETVVMYQSDEQEDGEERLVTPIGKDVGENKYQNAEHDQGVQDGPYDAEGHVPVANPEVLEHEMLDRESAGPDFLQEFHAQFRGWTVRRPVCAYCQLRGEILSVQP